MKGSKEGNQMEGTREKVESFRNKNKNKNKNKKTRKREEVLPSFRRRMQDF